MAVKATDAWRTPVNVTPAFWRRTILNAGGPAELASQAGYDAAYPLTALALAMLKRESSYATDFDANPASNKNPWNLKSPSYDGTYVMYATWPDGARGWRERITSTTYKDGVYARTITYANLINTYAPPSENQTNAYLAGVLQLMNSYELIDPPVTTPSTPEEPVEQEPSVALTIKRQMIPKGNRNRPGDKLNNAPLWITIHETDNPSRGADAEMHAQFVYNGGGSESVSFHGTVDDHEAYQMLPADEVGWHAGDGCNDRSSDLGCFQSFAIETCDNIDGNWTQTKTNLVEYCAALITGDPQIDFAGRKGQFSVDRIAQHNKWSGKNCPSTIRAEGSWNSILARIRARVAEIQGGTTPGEPSTTYADAHPVQKGSRVVNEHVFLAPGGKTFQKQTTPREYGDPGARATGPDIAKGTKITQDNISHYVVGTGAVPNIWLVLTGVQNVKDGSRVPAENLISDAA